MHTKLKTKHIPIVRERLRKAQGSICPLCKGKMTATTKKPALDHDHQTGFIRDTLCLNCNGIEGKVFNLARRAKHKLTTTQWLENLVAYHKRHEEPQHGGVIHPTHKTEAEKRLARNLKAQKKRAAAKAKANK